MKIHDIVDVRRPGQHVIIQQGVVVAMTTSGARVWNWRDKDHGGSPERARLYPESFEWFPFSVITPTGKNMNDWK